jgi:hypothetical protein
MSVLTGKYNNTKDLDKITEYMINRSNGSLLADHIWVDKIDEPIYDIVNKVRTSDEIYQTIKEQFPNHRIKNVNESDEIYYAVSPKYAGGSDRSLVDCHYDAPFGLLPNFNTIFYRVIVACNPNENVITSFPDENVHVKMNTGDFHGLDYNKNYHCAEGEIPENKSRVLLKLHYILIPEDYPNNTFSENYVKFINVTWTDLSRNFMRASANPTNIKEHCMGLTVNFLRMIFNNIYTVILLLITFYLILQKKLN